MTRRPLPILRMYWMEILVIEEQAKFLEPVYFWETENIKGA